jgi:hypothetical protein
MLITNSKELANFQTDKRLWQGIPGIEVTAKGRLFATFYSGGKTEERGNYCILIRSDDDGNTWSEPIAAAYDGEESRCFDPCLWIDPLGRLWFIWSMAPDFGVWCAICSNPDDDVLSWSEPKRIAEGVMMNKPVVLNSGEWLFPCAVWNHGISAGGFVNESDVLRRSFVYSTVDMGKTFVCKGGADVKDRTYDEHMVVELADGSLAMYVRTKYGIGKSCSYDGAVTWSQGEDSGLYGPSSRFFIGRLKSGNLLLIYHKDTKERNNLAAMLSTDDGRTWTGSLMIDSRQMVSYPDAVQAADGSIYVIYDRERGAVYDKNKDYREDAREILLAKFNEDDILNGSFSSEGSFSKKVVSKLV